MSLQDRNNYYPNSDPVPFFIKIEDDPDSRETINKLSTLLKKSNNCCEHEQNLDAFKIKENNELKIALHAKADEIRLLQSENRRLNEKEQILLDKIKQLENKIKILQNENSDSSDEYNHVMSHKQNCFEQNKQVMLLIVFLNLTNFYFDCFIFKE